MNLQTMQLLPVVYLLLVAIPTSLTDIREFRIPNKYILPTFPLWLVSAVAYAIASGDWLNTIQVPLALAFAMFVLLMFYHFRGGVGMGDVKLLVVMGLSLSWKSHLIWLAIPITIVLFVVVVIVFSVLTKRKYSPRYPLAPFAFVAYAVTTAVLFIN